MVPTGLETADPCSTSFTIPELQNLNKHSSHLVTAQLPAEPALMQPLAEA